MGDTTGSISVPAAKVKEKEGEEASQESKPMLQPSVGPLGLSRDTWARILIWFVPIIFVAGGAFASNQYVSGRVEKNEQALQTFTEKQQLMHTAQQVEANKLSTVKDNQKEIKTKVEEIDKKLDEQKDDLALIKAKLKVHEPRQDGDS